MTENHQIIKILILILVAVAISTSILSLIKNHYYEEWGFYTDYYDQQKYYQSIANTPHKIFIVSASYVRALNPYPMEEYLKSNHQDYEIYNLGLPARTPDKLYEILDLIIAAKPDIVVYGISPRDFDHIQSGDLRPEGMPDLSQIFHGISSSILDKLNISIFDPGFVPKLVVLETITSGRLMNSLPTDPQNLVISNVTSTSFTATWQPPSSWGTGKILGYNTGYGINEGPVGRIDTNMVATTKTYSGFPSGSVVFFIVGAATSSGNSPRGIFNVIVLPNATTGSSQPIYHNDWWTKVEFFGPNEYHMNYAKAANVTQMINNAKQYTEQEGTFLAPPDEDEKEIALNKIINKLEENHIKVIIFTTPQSKYYWSLVPSDFLKSYDVILKDISDKNNLKIYSLDHKYQELNVWEDANHILATMTGLTEYEKDICNIIISEVKS